MKGPVVVLAVVAIACRALAAQSVVIPKTTPGVRIGSPAISGAPGARVLSPLKSTTQTVSDTAIGLPADLLTVNGQRAGECRGSVERAQVRYRYDGVDPLVVAGPVPVTDGVPVAVGQTIAISGWTALTYFRAIRTTAIDAQVHWVCYR